MAKYKALLVGIDDYPPPNQLPSCVADANAMFGLLRSVGFDVDLLLNGDATIAGVTEKLRDLFKGVKHDDRLVFYYSGHGYTDRKNSLMEEYLVLTDGLFQDDVLSEMTQAVAPGVLTVILDSCFSGGMEKMLINKSAGESVIEVAKVKAWQPTDDGLKKLGAAPRPAPAKSKGTVAEVVQLRKFGLSNAASKQVVARTLAEPPPLQWAAKSFAPMKGPGSDEVGQTQTKGLLISACLETETAAASTSMTEGKSAFTYALLKAVRALGLEQSTTSIFQNAAQVLASQNFRQTPVVIAPTAMPDLASYSFLWLKPIGGAKPQPVATPVSSDGIDANLLSALLAALVPALVESQAKSGWRPCPEALPWWSSIGQPVKSQQDLSPVLVAILSAVLRAVSSRPS